MRARPSSLPRKLGQRRTAHAADLPLTFDLGADRLIEGDRRRVPVEHRPLEARIAVVDAGARKMPHQGLADAAAAEVRLDEDVLEIDAVPAAEGREIEKPDGEAGR